MTRLLSLLFFGFIGISSAYGQRGDDSREMSALEVNVTEAGTGNPVEMATVYIVPAGDTIVTVFRFTDKKGTALLEKFTAGKYVVNVQILGFKPYAQEIVCEPKTIRRLSIKLDEDLEELKGATLTEMGDLVTMKGDTLIYNASSFHTGSNANLGDLLKKMPGIEVANGRVSVNGEPISRITVEGKTFFFNDQAKALENLPAFIVNQIKVFDKESNGNPGMRGKKKEMDVKLKEEYREAWFGRASMDGGLSVNEKQSGISDDRAKGLYNAKIYAQYYGDDNSVTLLGGGNNVNHNQLSNRSTGLYDIASGGVNYSTSKIYGYDTDASASYDFRNHTSQSGSHRTSFLKSGEQLETNRNREENDMTHSAKANLKIGSSDFAREGFTVTGRFLYNKKRTSGKSSSSTINSNGYERNGSESRTDGNSNGFSANVNLEAKYYLDKKARHQIRFGGDVSYDGIRSNSSETSITRFVSTSDERDLLYADKSDDFRLNGYVNYNVSMSENWQMYSGVYADFNSSINDRDAENVKDYSRNDYYSRYANDRQLNLKQTVTARYWGNRDAGKYLSADFGLCVYEDRLHHYSKSTGAEANINDRWQLSAGPQLGISGRGSSWRYTFFTSGRNIVPPSDETNKTVPDFSNPTDIAIGNIYLESGYNQDVKLTVSRGHRQSGSGFMDIRLSGSMIINEITRAGWHDMSGIRYSIPVNAEDPSFTAGANLTYIRPLNRKKSLNLTVTPKVNFKTGTIYVPEGPLSGIDKEEFSYSDLMEWLYGDDSGNEFYSGRSGFIKNRTFNLNWEVNAGLKYELKRWSIRGGASVANSRNGYSAYPDAEVNNWRYNAFAEALWQSRNGWEIEGRFDFNGYRGFSSGYNKPEHLLNLRMAKTIKSFTFSLSGYDILGNSRSFSHISSAEYVEDTYSNNLGRCILAGISYNFGTWTSQKKSRMNFMEKDSNL